MDVNFCRCGKMAASACTEKKVGEVRMHVREALQLETMMHFPVDVVDAFELDVNAALKGLPKQAQKAISLVLAEHVKVCPNARPSPAHDFFKFLVNRLAWCGTFELGTPTKTAAVAAIDALCSVLGSAADEGHGGAPPDAGFSCSAAGAFEASGKRESSLAPCKPAVAC